MNALPHLLPLAQDDWPLFMISWGQLAPFSSKLAETLRDGVDWLQPLIVLRV